MPWKETGRFLFEKGLTYIMGDDMSFFFYISTELSRLNNREAMKKGGCGVDYCYEDHLHE